MAITDLLGLAFGGSRTADQSTLTVNTTAAVAAGELVVVAVSVDNTLGPPGVFEDFSVTSVSVGGNNLIRAESCGPGISTAQVGPGLSVWWQIIPSPVASGQPIVAKFANAAASDHAALNARHFSIGSGGVTVESSVRQYVATATDPPSMDITTANEQRLRYRAVSGRHGPSVGLGYSPAAGWASGTAYSGNANGTSPDWEITAYAESVVFTGTNKISDPSVFSGGTATVNANVYVVFKELPLTGTLAATEGGSDGASFSGDVRDPPIVGTLEAYEGAGWITADSTLYTADDSITRVNSATILRDVAAFAGQVVLGVTGTLAATEGTKDTALFAGTVAWPVITGVLAATEASDAVALAGFVQASGTLAATEARDIAAFAGGPVIAGTLAATETEDTAAFRAVLTNAGTFAAVEDSDTVLFAGEVAWTGTLAVTEAADTAAFTGLLGAIGTLAVVEAGDTPAFTGYLSLVDEKIGILNAYEDRVGGYYEPRADSTLVTADNTLFHTSIDYYGQDRALFAGEISISALINAAEAADTAVFAGGVAVTGVLAAAETSKDTAAFAGGVGTLVLGRLAAQEARDIALFSELELVIRGVLAALESSDTARFVMPKWEDVEEGAGLENEILRTVWLAGRGGRVIWLENEVEDTGFLQNLDPEMISLLAEQERITELRP